MITTHTQLLNALIEKYNLKSYLEIGVQNPAQNFDRINCDYKQGVDPADKSGRPDIFSKGSDDWFKFLSKVNKANFKFDLIFIDGLHHADQVKRDFENSLRCLSDNGFILIHDVLPENEAGTAVPRQTKQWWGDVYKWAMNIQEYNGIGFKTFNIDNGCMLVWKDSKAKYRFQSLPLTWEGYKEYGHKLMNVTNEVII